MSNSDVSVRSVSFESITRNCLSWMVFPSATDPLIFFAAPNQVPSKMGILRSLVPLVSIINLLFSCVFYSLYSP
jgi:hypothetical protein